jgi:Spy/CpxP family protein refolding chaperone
MKRLICAALAAALLVPGMWALSARAHDEKSEEHKGPRPEMGARMKEKLGLTDEQAGKLKDAMAAHGEAVKPLHRKMRDTTAKLTDQLQDKASDADIKATLDSMKATRAAMTAEEEKFHASLASFLTPTQQAKMLVGMMRQMHEKMMGRGGRGERRPGEGKPAPKDKDDDHDDDKGE